MFTWFTESKDWSGFGYFSPDLEKIKQLVVCSKHQNTLEDTRNVVNVLNVVSAGGYGRTGPNPLNVIWLENQTELFLWLDAIVTSIVMTFRINADSHQKKQRFIVTISIVKM